MSVTFTPKRERKVPVSVPTALPPMITALFGRVLVVYVSRFVQAVI